MKEQFEAELAKPAESDERCLLYSQVSLTSSMNAVMLDNIYIYTFQME